MRSGVWAAGRAMLLASPNASTSGRLHAKWGADAVIGWVVDLPASV